MAEGWARYLKSDEIDAYSAGIEKHGIDPSAVKAMAEAGVDISGQDSKLIDELPVKEFDYVVTLCGHANEHCPWFPAKTRVIHIGFDDPPRRAADAKSEEEAFDNYRRVRDEIRTYIESLPEKFTKQGE